ncbi:hypothetical protein CH63R_01559 [Colletotrichum higginsianum IMI 349063]|uniref:Uncharacterized protein n=1 Tax=Colletotrichum higginsianum (strain IMI 349063) TaxID=759273 RepID=A0A1B7YWF4_COLHI|nr:hypothetical protein CH63R_01559 [Colletotrichum higginsianum IMI 349063]OBR16379.1 hypothetical protein CH63R_01559 [Colletotrichum higginsianum IMI 349063]
MKKAEAYQSIEFYFLSSEISNSRDETDPTAFSSRRHQDPGNLVFRISYSRLFSLDTGINDKGSCDLPRGCGRKFYVLPRQDVLILRSANAELTRVELLGPALRPGVKNGRMPYPGSTTESHERGGNENEKGEMQGGKSYSIDNSFGDAWNNDRGAWEADRELQHVVYRVRRGVRAVNGSGTSHGTMHRCTVAGLKMSFDLPWPTA